MYSLVDMESRHVELLRGKGRKVVWSDKHLAYEEDEDEDEDGFDENESSSSLFVHDTSRLPNISVSPPPSRNAPVTHYKKIEVIPTLHIERCTVTLAPNFQDIFRHTSNRKEPPNSMHFTNY